MQKCSKLKQNLQSPRGACPSHTSTFPPPIDMKPSQVPSDKWQTGFSLYFQIVHSTVAISRYETPSLYTAIDWEARLVTAVGRI